MACKLLIFNDAKITGTRRLDFFDSLSCNVVFGTFLQNATFRMEIRNMGWIAGEFAAEIFPLTINALKSIF